MLENGWTGETHAMPFILQNRYSNQHCKFKNESYFFRFERLRIIWRQKVDQDDRTFS